jgi:UDP-glucuronate 4-epimerase
MTILVTGGAGFIGSHLVHRLLAKGNQVIVLDNFDPFYNPKIKKRNIKGYIEKPNFEFYNLDIREKDKVKEKIREQDIETIVHLAARPGVRPSIENPYLYEEINVKGTISILELSQEQDIKNFIFGSSSSVYGISQNIPFKEDDPIDKIISPYGITKRSCELYCYTYSHLYGIPITCLRFFTVYGPRQRPEMAIHKFIRLIEQNKEIPLFGDGTSKRDYTYIDDIIDGIESSIERIKKFDVFNLGNSKPIELKYLMSVIEKTLKKKAKIKQLQNQAGDVPITYADITKAKKILGYNPKTSIEDGIQRTVSWYKKWAQLK